MTNKGLGSKSLYVFAAVVAAVLLFWQFAFAATTGTIMPKADGNYSQWTPKTGTTHFAMVDETPCNGTTDYNFTNTVGQRDSYVVATSTIPNGATITQIDIKPCASRDVSNAGTASVMNVFYRFGGVDSADAGAYSFAPGSGNTPTEQSTTTYSGLSLLQTSTTSLEVGAVFTSGTAAKGLRLSRIATFVTYTALASPTNLSGTATTTSAVGLTWIDNATNEDGFSLYRSIDGILFSPLASTTANAATGTVSYYDSGLSAGTKYYYKVQAFNSGATTGFASTSVTTLTTPPADPSGLSAAASQTNPIITLSWTDNSSNETNFEVLRSTDGINFAHLATTSANVASTTNSGLASSTTYYYQVRAFNSAGYSGLSNTASDTTGIIPTAASNLVPDASTTAPFIGLSWTDNSSNELSVSVEVSSSSPTSGFLLVANLPANSSTTTYVPKFANLLYYFRILTGNGYGITTSDVASTTSGSVPADPSGLGLTQQPGVGTTTDIVLDWTDNSSNELGFRIERSIGTSTLNFSQIATTSPGVITYTDPSLLSGTYTYRVRAFNSIGNSAFSNQASTTIP